ncbi:MAG: response regulator [Chitinispirillales bacterium]|jgi:signal transduction histidine kinase/CheY-like chemotaxis protein/HPt (histidine-containing phosphotransfer) domain-containing protein|nr:response regulator [Chitinispirillales bacterium]
MKQKKIGFKLLIQSSIAFSIVLFVIVLAAGGTIFTLSMRQVIKNTKGGELVRTLESERAKLEAPVNDRINTVLRMAESPYIRRYFINPHNRELEIAAIRDIDKFSRAFSNSTILWVSDNDKRLFSEGRHIDTINPADTTYDWYNATLHRIGNVNLNLDHNPFLNITRLWINAPVFNNMRRPIGMVRVGIDVSTFINAVYDDNNGNMQLFLFNGQGEITAARNSTLVTTRRRIEDRFGSAGREIMSAARNLRPGETRIFSMPRGEAAVMEIPSLGWYALAITPSGIDDYATTLTWLFLSMLVIMGVILIVLNVFIVGLFKPLQNTSSDLAVALKVKDDFLAKMSHEIRTPMNAITGMAELALREEMSHSAQEHVYTIKQAGANLLSIINDILDLSKIESGKLGIIPAEYHFGSLVNDVVSIIRMRVVDSEVKFVVNTDCNIPSVLVGDEVRVRQVLLNILSNAVKYTKDGFICLAISGKITDDDTVVLTMDVTDTGRGIKREDVGKLFGTFVQVDVESNRGIEGTGLGLVITKNLITAMGGNISVMSEYGKGSIFTITLPQKIYSGDPLAIVDEPEEKRVIICERRDVYANSMVCTIDNLGVDCACAQSHDELRAKITAGDYPFVFVESAMYEDVRNILTELSSRAKIVLLTSFGNVVADKDLSVITMPANSVSVANILNGVSDGFSYHTEDSTVVKFNAPEAKVLVVDDIQTNLEVTRGLLSPYDMQVDICLSGKEAVQMVKANQYDLIFMDHMMPDMDGIETTKRIRGLSAYYKTPIIALTANAVSGAKEMFLENDFNGFLSKPVDIPKLNSLLEKWIPKKKQKPAVKKPVLNRESDTGIVIEGVDVKSGISRMGGSSASYLRTLGIFSNDGREKVEEIKKSLLSNNLPLFTITVHALKGASANIGAAAFSETARDMEMAGKREDRIFIKENIGRLLTEFGTLLRNIDKAILAKKEAHAQPAVDKETIRATLISLSTAINNLDPDVINAAAAELRRVTGTPEIGGKIERILQNTLIGEYDAAVSLIGALLKEMQ